MKHWIGRVASLFVVLGVAVLDGGCLVKETTSTLCLEPDGSVRWSVLQRDIHATGDTPAARQQEEEAFMALVAVGRHPVAEAFRAVGGSNVTTHVVSDKWPFAVLTEADFPDISGLVEEGFHGTTIGVQSTLTRNGDRVTWTLDIDASQMESESAESTSDDTPIVDLLPDDRPVLFMRHGRFVEAVGFEIGDDGRVAKPDDLSKHDWGKEPRVRLSLTWVATEATTARIACE